MANRLLHRVCVVTGSTGMAEAAAHRIGEEGGVVFVVSRRTDDAARLAREVVERGGTAGSHGADLTEEEAAEAAFAACMDRFGRIDGLFAVAGGSARRAGDGPAHEAPLTGFEAALDVNAVPAYLAARQAVRHMLFSDVEPGAPRGSIVLMSSVLASSPSRLFATHGYAASKGAIESLTRTMAAFYAGDGIRVNAVAPGLVATPMSARAQADPTSVAYAASKQPLAGGLLPAESAADLAVFLLADESRYITGQVIALDGGWSVSEATR
jgi:NAD(P)-dependent dehydrogenase (short-subunit alcohol dehydrogenase family)